MNKQLFRFTLKECSSYIGHNASQICLYNYFYQQDHHQHTMQKSFSQNVKRPIEYQDQNEYSKLVATNQSQTMNNNVYNYIQPPRQLPQRHYSLEPDIKTGWKPTVKVQKIQIRNINIFSIRYEDEAINEIMKELIKNANKYRQAIVYLGNRRYNSFSLHQNRKYENPYNHIHDLTYLENKALKPHHHPNFVPKQSFLKFNSDFQGGNLDMVVQRASNQFDLFMRADTNTRGHTNWYNFQVYNGIFIGQVKFNICNFRRRESLYQKNLKPYVYSKLCKANWTQKGENVVYLKQKLRYNLLKHQELKLDKYYKLSFTYKFQKDKDTTKFAYLPPYTYSQLIQLINTLKNITIQNSFKSLTGLSIPVLKITKSSSISDYLQKKVVIVTARIHPGQSNSSYVCEGFLQFLCSNDSIAKELRSKFIFYVVPMMNPDGVIAGNFRTSLFGKDLNRTFDTSRKYAFPQTYQLLKLAQQLKKNYTNNFLLYIDLHGHSKKKNAFTYGPQYSIQDSKYEASRQLPKIISSITNLFRFYACSFRIPVYKLSTSRAVFYNQLKIPYTYTLEVSNGFYYDQQTHSQHAFDIKSWKQVGISLGKALNEWRSEKSLKINRIILDNFTMNEMKRMPNEQKYQQNQNQSIEDSDADDIQQDLSEKILQQLQKSLMVQQKDSILTINKKNKKANGKSLKKDDRQKSLIPNNRRAYFYDKKKYQKGLQQNLLNTSQNTNKKKEIKNSSALKKNERKNINLQSTITQLFIKRNRLYDHLQKNKSQGIKKLQYCKEDSQLIYYIGKNKRKAQQFIDKKVEIQEDLPRKKNIFDFNDLNLRIKNYNP